MSKHYEQLPRFNAAGLATGTILALIVAMGLSVFLDVRPAEVSTTTQLAHNASRHA